jgi:phosphatidate cytidylyltransferase
MKRVSTGVLGATIVLLALFGLDSHWFFWFCAAVFLLAVAELARIIRCSAPQAPVWPLFLTVPGIAFLLSSILGGNLLSGSWDLFAVGALLSVAAGLVVLLGRTPMDQALVAAGGLAFGSVYLAVPLASVAELHRISPQVLLLGLSIVWAGDAAALYVGKAFGRSKMAPVVSPNKTWEGAAASLAAGLLVTAAWSVWTQGRVTPLLLLVGAATSCAGQVGDLFESMLKRGAGIKDSGTLLPGHGGVLDRIDALLFGAPVLFLGWQLLGL